MHKLTVFSYPSGSKVSWGGKECPLSHCPSFLTHPRSKPTSLAETISLEGTKEFGKGYAFVRLFRVADWLLPDQTKRDKPTKSMRAQSTFLSTALYSFLFYDEILNQEPREKLKC
jgi:hypothetical protein